MDQMRLVEQAQRGDHAAFSSLISTFGQTLFGVALRVAGDPDVADDAVQETIITAWRELPRLREPDRIAAWLIRIVVRKSSRLARSARAVVPMAVALPAVAAVSDIDQLVDRDALERAFGRVSVAHREVLVLRYYLDLETQDIAQILEVPHGTVRSRLHYALEALRAVLDAEERSARKASR